MNMKIHTSYYEQAGWINLEIIKPAVKKRIKLAQIYIMDWNLENMNWCTDGYLLENGTFSLKACEGLTIKNSIPTHWMEI